jgi:hypothetical protein
MKTPHDASARGGTHERARSAALAKYFALLTPGRAAQGNHALLLDDFLHPMRSSIYSNTKIPAAIFPSAARAVNHRRLS